MPYNDENKRKAKQYVAEVRACTFCEKCGSQPIEWHHIDHELDGNQRVAHLVSLGFPIERIKQEIEKCEALCRSCHMKEDGRLKALHESMPNQKGMIIVPPQPCTRCNNLAKPTRKGMCRKCYDYLRRH